MNDLCVDVGFNSLIKKNEVLCGDNVSTITCEDGTFIAVLADGLGSGVKACILSTLTSKIISTMVSENIDISECVKTIAATLPICQVRGLAYSTFTILKILPTQEAEIFQYDNPDVIFMRDGKNVELPYVSMNIDGKEITHTKVKLLENDTFILMSDGVIHAGVQAGGMSYAFGWERENIVDYMEIFSDVGFSAKTLCSILLDECYAKYSGSPGDDSTVCVVKLRKRNQVNLLIGPPENPDDCDRMMSLFFSKGGKHIVCGGTTSKIAAKYLGKPLKVSLDSGDDPSIPAKGEIEGVDLVTEGVITMSRVLEYAKDHIGENALYGDWSYKRGGAAEIARMLFDEATDINFYVGRAVNPAHQNPDLPINFNIKMNLVNELAECLKKMGKRIKVSYF